MNDAHTNGETKNSPRLNRVTFNNPQGCRDYQGTVKRIFKVGNQEWADINWDIPVHPCTTPMQTKHLIYGTNMNMVQI